MRLRMVSRPLRYVPFQRALRVAEQDDQPLAAAGKNPLRVASVLMFQRCEQFCRKVFW